MDFSFGTRVGHVFFVDPPPLVSSILHFIVSVTAADSDFSDERICCVVTKIAPK